MDIIISANQGILEMVRNQEIEISRDMSEEEYYRWLQSVEKDDTGDENRLQEISL